MNQPDAVTPAPQDVPQQPIRAAVVVSDPHAGSTVSLMPPGFVTNEGNEIVQNGIQKWLWERWLRADYFVSEIMDGDPFALVILGDCIEGDHHGTKQIISKDLGDHVACAAQVLKPLCGRAAKVFIIRGTEVHVNNHEIAIGHILGAVRDPNSHPNPEKQSTVFDALAIDIAGVRCMFRHHIGTAIRSYLTATQYSIAINEEIVEAVNAGDVIPRVIERAHRHRFGHWDDGKSMCCVSAPWQALTRFGHKVVGAARAHPGIHILDWREKDDGELPALHYRMYDPPIPEAISL